MDEPKRHHLVPKFILERFAKDGAIELVEREDFSKVIPTNPQKALRMKDFYTVETEDGPDTRVEKVLATDIEDPAAISIRRLVDQERPIVAPGIRRPIALFLALQRVRGRASREMLVQFAEKVARRIVEIAPASSYIEVAREHGEEMTQEEADELVAAAQDYHPKLRYPAALHVSSLIKGAPQMAKLIDARVWRLYEFDAPLLVTCDEPVALIGKNPRVPGEALGYKNAREIVFPIDPWHALVLLHPDTDVPEGRFPAGLEQAAIINLHVAFSAHRFIVRHPGTDPLRGVVLPKKAPSVVEVGNLIGMQQGASEVQRVKTIEEQRRRLRKRSKVRGH
jgi:hypothetical protein